MRNKKRSQKDWAIIKSVNEHLRAGNVQNESDNLFVWLCDYLLRSNKYEGFNYYKYEERLIGNEMVKVVVLAGSYDPNEFEFLQIN